MNRLLILSILTILVSYVNNVAAQAIDYTENINDRLERHFDFYRLKPSIEINNTEGNQTNIQLANHKIKWFNSEDETKIKIDNDLFTLKDKVTLNEIQEDKDSVDFANNWDEIKLFKHNGREYIGIRMSFEPCTGLACSVNYYLIYDVKTKTKNFFGTFRTENELELFDFGNDDKIDYISKTYLEQNDIEPQEIINLYKLYSIDITGKFSLQVDSQHKPYFIKRTFNSDTDKEIEEKFEQHWVTKIK